MAEKFGKETTSDNENSEQYKEPEVEDEGLLNKVINFFSKNKN